VIQGIDGQLSSQTNDRQCECSVMIVVTFSQSPFDFCLSISRWIPLSNTDTSL